MFRSATLRLTLWYLAIVMAISLIFSGLLYEQTSRDLKQGLSSVSQSIYNQFPVFDGDPNFNISPGPYYRTSIHQLLLRLTAFNVVVFVAAGFSSYFFARRTLKPIEAAHEQQKRFTSDVSHELRTPLTAIKMESEVALMNNKASLKDLKATITSNLEEVAKLEGLINNLLRLSRLEINELQQNFSFNNTKDLFDQATHEIANKAVNHQLKVDIEKNPPKVYGDKESLGQLLVILLDNAIKYSPKDSQIVLSARSGKDEIRWMVEDHGVGIDEKSIKHVFDRFYQANIARTKDSSNQGYGLGLSIAQMISDIHDATITITSQKNVGTKVTVSLPRVKHTK